MRTLDDEFDASHADSTDAQEGYERKWSVSHDEDAVSASDSQEDTLAALDSIDSFLKTHDYGILFIIY
jgi:hypothetical protein